MARTGVSYSEVSAAATQLIGQGRNPTVEQVRLLLGTGSSTTIGNHLRQWKENQESTTLISAKENMPAELVAVMKGVWEKVKNLSQEQIAKVEQEVQQEIAQLTQQVEKYQSNNQRWQKLHDQWHQEKNTLLADKLTLEQALEFAQKENLSLHVKQDSFLEQSQEKDIRINELNRLHQQTQANLEHYREATREQRLLDQQQHEQQKQQLQNEIKILNEQFIKQREKTTELQQQYQELQQSSARLKKSHDEIESQHQRLSIEFQQSEKDRHEYKKSSLHWQTQHQDLQTLFNDKNNLLIDSQIQIKLLSQQLADLKQTLVAIQDQNKFLAHEKWEIAQEKAQLEGQLKQMQKMMVV
jgi:hypothetical protein